MIAPVFGSILLPLAANPSPAVLFTQSNNASDWTTPRVKVMFGHSSRPGSLRANPF